MNDDLKKLYETLGYTGPITPRSWARAGVVATVATTTATASR